MKAQKNDLDSQLLDCQRFRTGNWVKLISIIKGQSNAWAEARLKREGHADFKMVYMPVIMNISPSGTSNGELAAHARVTKQAMSKVARELQNLGYIKAKKDPTDKRSTIFTLTDRGKKLVIRAVECVEELTVEYRKLVGSKEFEQATKTMRAILEYNDQMIVPKK